MSWLSSQRSQVPAWWILGKCNLEWCRAASFAFGLATTLALLGVGSSFLGKAYGQIGSGLPIVISLLAIVMGLNLLEVIQLNLPSLDVDVRKFSAPPLLQVCIRSKQVFLYEDGYLPNYVQENIDQR